MKKNILNIKHISIIILTFILSWSISAYAAYKYYANQISYEPKSKNFNVANVKEALDYFYNNKINYEDYDNTYEITPSTNTQTLQTTNKLLEKNITINEIPNTYKNLTTLTTATSSKILNGYTVYNSNGQLITGTASPECVSGSYTKTANNQVTIDFGLVPSFYIINISSHEGRVSIIYNKNEDSNVKVIRHYDDSFDTWNYITLDETKVTTQASLTGGIYQKAQKVTYMACK